MATLTANITADAEILPVSAEIVSGDYTIDSEAIHVYGTSRGAQGRAFDRLFVSVERGIGGTTKATHSSGATLTRYYPGAPGGGGGGGVTVDNTVDAPFAATTLIAPGAVESGPDEATLSGGPIEFLSTTVILDRADIWAMHGTAQQILAPTESPGYSGTPTQLPIVSWATAILDTDGTAFANVPSPVNLLLVWGGDWSLTIGKVMDGVADTAANVGSFFTSPGDNIGWLPFSNLSFDAPFGFVDAFADNGVYLLVVGDGGGGDTEGPLTGGGANATLTVRIQYTVIDL